LKSRMHDSRRLESDLTNARREVGEKTQAIARQDIVCVVELRDPSPLRECRSRPRAALGCQTALRKYRNPVVLATRPCCFPGAAAAENGSSTRIRECSFTRCSWPIRPRNANSRDRSRPNFEIISKLFSNFSLEIAVLHRNPTHRHRDRMFEPIEFPTTLPTWPSPTFESLATPKERSRKAGRLGALAIAVGLVLGGLAWAYWRSNQPRESDNAAPGPVCAPTPALEPLWVPGTPSEIEQLFQTARGWSKLIPHADD